MDAVFLQGISRDWVVTSSYFAVLVSAMFADICLGLLVAFRGKKLDSSIGRNGVIRKVAMLLMVLTLVVFDGVVPSYPIDLFGHKLVLPMASVACVWFIVGVEWVSLTEKAKLLGVPMPKRLADALKRVRDAIENENTKDSS